MRPRGEEGFKGPKSRPTPTTSRRRPTTPPPASPSPPRWHGQGITVSHVSAVRSNGQVSPPRSWCKANAATSPVRAIMRDEKRVWRNPQETIISRAYLLPTSGMRKKIRNNAGEKHSHVARHRNRRAKPLSQQAINFPGRSSLVDDEILRSRQKRTAQPIWSRFRRAGFRCRTRGGPAGPTRGQVRPIGKTAS